LPEGILDYFELGHISQKELENKLHTQKLTIELVEKKEVPKEFKNYPHKACGFAEPRYVTDYPIRSNLVKFKIISNIFHFALLI
jgi:hypothetical protein